MTYMQHAISIAARAHGRTEPNPMVGALIVDENGIIVGEGYHQQAGTAHAEIHALRQAGSRARHATVYVSLEPCSHYGHTPPCTEALIEAGVKRVVIAMQDPNPQVAGNGIKRLQAAGIEVETGILEQEAARLNEVFIKHIQTGLPFIASKTAMTLDGKIATKTGDSKWISNEQSRHYVHQLRNQYQAIMVGIGTVMIDDPRLNTRLETSSKRDPVRVIIDTKLDIPVQSRIVQSAEQQKTVVFCGRQVNDAKCRALEKRGVQINRVDSRGDLLSMQQVFKLLYEQGICSILVEGGSSLNGTLLQEKWFDRVYFFIAPKIIGGHSAPGPFGGVGCEKISQGIRVIEREIHSFGEDLMITGRLSYESL
ncbi:MAG TPA: bifunctional diaminohydroxyphosphoribosylaminopyrimidine deaminase/5-amino-6-(5-phosphoribosylamino)uracil reductase RibD [Syntrophomonadaceae bacterium]|nr:bifunctional diaminohydroxyphosphoribosylaminopyrimidine deaminase/5-amino-6-(5-phosphoribosylamino)uracil reductase RibD [Syntrophomonadaceae bacterium]